MWVLQNVIMNQKLSKIDNYLPNKKEVNTAFQYWSFHENQIHPESVHPGGCLQSLVATYLPQPWLK